VRGILLKDMCTWAISRFISKNQLNLATNSKMIHKSKGFNFVYQTCIVAYKGQANIEF